MMIFKVIGLIIVIGLIFVTIVRLVPPPEKISQPVSSSDNQFEVFRDMEPASQTRVNQWVGFLQEDVSVNRTGPIGDFEGNDSPSGNAKLYEFISE
jgi:hypothetical protein